MANNGFDYGAATRQHENHLGLLVASNELAIWLAESRDYDLFIYKVY